MPAPKMITLRMSKERRDEITCIAGRHRQSVNSYLMGLIECNLVRERDYWKRIDCQKEKEKHLVST